MSVTLPPIAARNPLLRTEMPDHRMAKAVLRKADKPTMGEHRIKIGAALERARTLRGWNLDELATAIGRDSRQIARWITGEERPHFDALFAVDDWRFRNALITAMAELGSGVVIDTVIRLRLTKEQA